MAFNFIVIKIPKITLRNLKESYHPEGKLSEYEVDTTWNLLFIVFVVLFLFRPMHGIINSFIDPNTQIDLILLQ